MREDENLTAERPTFVTHLECSATGERHPADELHNLSRAGKPLLLRYDLEGFARLSARRRWHDVRAISGAIVSCCRCGLRKTS